MLRFLIVMACTCAVAMLLLPACSQADRKRTERDARDTAVREGTETAIDELTNDGDDDEQQDEQVEPDDTTEAQTDDDGLYHVGNESCPLLGHPVSVEVEVNGYVIGVCCAGCASNLKDNPDDHQKVVLDELNIDISVPAAEYMESLDGE